jgi:hypothetical protein
MEGVRPRVHQWDRRTAQPEQQTLNTYSHVIPALGKEVATHMDKALSG